VYHPENYDREFRGSVPARTALASSLNIPAVKTLNLVSGEVFVRKLRAFGFTELEEPEQYGPSLALGTADVSLWDLVNAYRTLANGGVRTRFRLSPENRSNNRTQALSRETAYIISDILSDREARSATFSLESPLATRYWTAVKTGTSKDMRDNWCIGYSDRYTVGVWIGNFSGAAMWDVSGVSGAAPVWLEIMNYLHSGISSKPPARPQSVRLLPVSFRYSGREFMKEELFLSGTEQEFVRLRSVEIQPKIVYPAPDTQIAVDPDIPGDLQRVFFEASSADPALRIVLDETVLGPAPSVAWAPVRGKHVLTLRAGDGSTADRISFEVK
jgi:penicillin-binding protein 1C